MFYKSWNMYRLYHYNHDKLGFMSNNLHMGQTSESLS